MTTRVPAGLLGAFPGQEPSGGCAEPWGTQYPLAPHYRAQSPFDEVIRQTEPGHDAYISELYAEEVSAVLAGWSVALQLNPADVGSIVRTLSPGLTATPLQPKEEVALRNDRGLQVWRGRFVALMLNCAPAPFPPVTVATHHPFRRSRSGCRHRHPRCRQGKAIQQAAVHVPDRY